MSGRAILTAALLALVAGTAATARAAVSCSASLDRERAAVGEQVVLTLSVTGEVRGVQPPRLPALPDFETYAGGESQRYSFVNGRVQADHSYTWYLRPLKKGDFEIPPIEVVADGKTYRTAPLPLEVVDAPAGSSPGPSTRSSRPAPPRGGDAGRPGDQFFVTMTVDRDTVVVGEQVVLTFSFYRGVRGSLFDSPQYTPPTTEGFWREDLPPEKHSSLSIQGVPYDVTQIQYALFPTRTGPLEIGEAVVHIPEDRFGSLLFRRRGGGGGDVTLRAPAIPITVRSLPGGAPEGFEGTVASGLNLSVRTDRQTLAVGDALTVSLLLEGQGYLAAAEKPRLPELEGFRQHDAGSSLDSRPAGGRLWGALQVEKLLIPTREGSYTLPPVRYSYFDTAERRYRTLSTRPVQIEVTPAEGEPISSFATGGKSEIEILGQDILHIHAIEPKLGGAPSLLPPPAAWGLALLAPLLWAGSVVGAARRRRLLADPQRLRAGRALKEARALLAVDGPEAQRASDAVLAWVAAKSGRRAAGLTRPEVALWLRERRAPSDLIDRVESLLDRCDHARFAAGAGTTGLVTEAGEVLEALEKEAGRGAD